MNKKRYRKFQTKLYENANAATRKKGDAVFFCSTELARSYNVWQVPIFYVD